MSILEKFNQKAVAPLLAIITGVLGVYAVQLDNVQTQIETTIAQKEFSNSLKIQMYTEVKTAIEQQNKKIIESTFLILDEMLSDPADTAYREKLKMLFFTSPLISDSQVTDLKEIEQKTETYNQQQDSLVSLTSARLTIDVFYLDDITDEAEPLAQKAVKKLQSKYPDYKIRLRPMPRNINAKPGYRISANEIRYDANELDIANGINQAINDIFPLEKPRLRKVTNPTSNYISVFIRNK